MRFSLVRDFLESCAPRLTWLNALDEQLGGYQPGRQLPQRFPEAKKEKCLTTRPCTTYYPDQASRNEIGRTPKQPHVQLPAVARGESTAVSAKHRYAVKSWRS